MSVALDKIIFLLIITFFIISRLFLMNRTDWYMLGITLILGLVCWAAAWLSVYN
jgi:hypothetical protein